MNRMQENKQMTDQLSNDKKKNSEERKNLMLLLNDK